MENEFVKGVCGEGTRTKQDTFRAYINHHIKIVNGMSWKPEYHFIDAFAGPGYILNCKHYEGAGSSIIFNQIAQFEGLNYKMWAAESDPESRKLLTEILELENAPAIILNDAMECIPDAPLKWQMGCVYIDPPMSYETFLLSGELMAQFAEMRPRMDLVFYVMATAIKRLRCTNSVNFDRELVDLLPKKEAWIISEPNGKGQYAFLVGTNYSGWAEWKSKGFYNIKSKRGWHILKELNYTKKEQLFDARQMKQGSF